MDSALVRKCGAIVFIALSAVALTGLFEAEAGETSAWTVASSEGAVMIDGKTVEMSGAAVGQGTVIETGADGNVVLTRPGDSITVFPNSKMSVPETASAGEPGILQSLGKLLFRMESRESRDFKIETPYLAAAIKGTTFTVEVESEDATVEVLEGSVLVSANRSGQSSYVGPGEQASVAGDGGDAVQVSKTGDDGVVDNSQRTGSEGSMEKSSSGDLSGGSKNEPNDDDPGGKDSSADHDSGKGNDDK